ncbi:hypothetical protein [Peribacillus frigoritolerans]|uniref:Resolvase/invertase-type recombinase catalytic domain-containing protein n=1 Tax=Peribacillus castrilensis TaxID=2897690 RepID=A0AAW9NMS2_9BACI|nr:hypothetical protein [Peribacillus castrilensis]
MLASLQVYGFYLNVISKLIGEECTRLLREKRVYGDPAGASRGRTARGKRVPGAEINVQIVQAINKRQTNSNKPSTFS